MDQRWARVELVAGAASLNAVQRWGGCTENKECVYVSIYRCEEQAGVWPERVGRGALTWGGCTENKECNRRAACPRHV